MLGRTSPAGNTSHDVKPPSPSPHSGSVPAFEAIFCLRDKQTIGRPHPPPVLPIGAPPGTDSNPSPLDPYNPFRRDLTQNGALTRAHPAVSKNHGSRVRGAYRGDCEWIECPNQLWWYGANRQAVPRRPHSRTHTTRCWQVPYFETNLDPRLAKGRTPANGGTGHSRNGLRGLESPPGRRREAFCFKASGSERPADLERAVMGTLEAHRRCDVFASTSSSIWCFARHAECPLGFGLLGKALQMAVPIGLISARSGPKRAAIEHGARIGAWASMSRACRDRNFCLSVLRPFGDPSGGLRGMRLWSIQWECGIFLFKWPRCQGQHAGRSEN